MVGHYGFLVVDGECEDTVVWLDNDYQRVNKDIEYMADEVDDILGFLLGEVMEEYRKVNDEEEDGEDGEDDED